MYNVIVWFQCLSQSKEQPPTEYMSVGCAGNLNAVI